MSEIVAKLKEFTKLTNLADEVDLSTDKEDHKAVLARIGSQVITSFNNDHNSMGEWLADVKKVEEIAAMCAKKKNRPLPNSANIKFPLISKAAYEFTSRVYPEIVKEGKVVKSRVIGLDLTGEYQQRADRVADYMNYQLLFETEDWELELDRLLYRLALVGCLFKKSYYDPIRKRNVSELCDEKDLIIDSEVKSLDEARRISHVIHLRLNDLIEHKQAGLFLKEVVDEEIEVRSTDTMDKVIDIIEQHTFLDLDGDNYAEPYIVTVIKESGKVLRIAPRFTKETVISNKEGDLKYIDAIQMFTDFHFLVSPKGKFQSVGFGILMLHLNETINSILNQLVDAGQLSNLQGGYKDSRLKNIGSGDTLHDPGEWKTIKAMAGATLKDGMFPINYKEPSDTLYKLLGLLIESGKDLSSSTEVNTGSTDASNAKTGAVQALQQAGLKVATSIQRRVYRSLTGEFRKLFKLNGLYADPKKYFTILNQHKFAEKDDFDCEHVHIIPIADPNLASEQQKSQRTQLLLALQQLPGANKVAITKLIAEMANLNVPIEQLITEQQAPDPVLMKVQGELVSWAEDKKLKAHELEIRQYEAKIEAAKVVSQLQKDKAQSLLFVAQAAAQQDAGKLKEYELQLKVISTHLDALHDAAQLQQEGQIHQNEMAANQVDQQQNQQAVDQDGQQQAPPQGSAD